MKYERKGLSQGCCAVLSAAPRPRAGIYRRGQGQGRTGGRLPVYAELEDHNPNLPQYDYDPAKADSLLDSAGYKDTDGNGIRNDPQTGDDVSLVLIVLTERTE